METAISSRVHEVSWDRHGDLPVLQRHSHPSHNTRSPHRSACEVCIDMRSISERKHDEGMPTAHLCFIYICCCQMGARGKAARSLCRADSTGARQICIRAITVGIRQRMTGICNSTTMMMQAQVSQDLVFSLDCSDVQADFSAFFGVQCACWKTLSRQWGTSRTKCRTIHQVRFLFRPCAPAAHRKHKVALLTRFILPLCSQRPVASVVPSAGEQSRSSLLSLTGPR